MRILYATDGSEGSLAAGRFLSSLAHRRDTHVHIVTGLEHHDPGDGSQILAAARAALGDFPGHLTTGLGRTSGFTGDTAEWILCTADDVQPDLIVVGATGRSAVARFFLGSVAEAVTRHADRPVLLVRPHGAPPLTEVLLGTDGSDAARDAAGWVASSLLLPNGCAVRLTRVLPAPLTLLPGLYTAAVREANHQAVESAREAVDAEVRLLQQRERCLDTTGDALTGDPAATLLEAAEERVAGLIVIGCHSLTAVERFLLGSVSDKVIRHARCSVLVVRPPR